tara:strand:+ start:277 stop:519 length:243 start_codon:yes stop_codon:yes gene_type:complete
MSSEKKVMELRAELCLIREELIELGVTNQELISAGLEPQPKRVRFCLKAQIMEYDSYANAPDTDIEISEAPAGSQISQRF